MTCQLDHLVVAARTLNEGIGHVARLLGMPPALGGQHARMGTHNALLSLGRDCYLEVIAIDPQGATPDFPRWFGLDHFSGVPRLVHWVARTPAIETACPPDWRILDMSRGDFRWRFALPADGSLPLNGALPALIQWQDGGHPCNRLPDHGLRLKRLHVTHGDTGALSAELGRLGLADAVRIDGKGPALCAQIDVGGKIVELV